MMLIVLFAVLLQTLAHPHVRRLSIEEEERLRNWTPESKQQRWEISGQFEGDMILHPDQRNGIIDESYRWPALDVPYEIQDTFNPAERTTITDALAEFTAKTCISPRPRTANDTEYVLIMNMASGCWSQVGYRGTSLLLNLDPSGCVTHGIAIHEFLHALGFYHMQGASERDDYVTIMWANILAGQEHNFDKYDNNTVTSFGELYDYGSVMHYGEFAFSSNGLPTIVTTDPNAVIGQRNGLSDVDIIKLNKMYKCV